MSGKSLEVIYVAGPFSSPIPAQQSLNIHDAVRFGQKVRALGFIPLVPHVAILPTGTTEAEYEAALAECFELLSRSDALVLMPTWRKSPGAIREREFAEQLGLPVFMDTCDLLEAAHAIE
jgi:hypothetical protein